MARIDVFSGLTEFMAVADQGSFRSAAAQLRVSPAAVSQAVRVLEVRVGMPLFLRTTRSVALTEAGAQLHRRLRSATGEIVEALGDIDALRQRPSGVLRLSVPRIALDLVALPVLPGFRWRVLGTPAYLAQHGVPRKPEDLFQHQCIGYRFPTAKMVYRWQLQNKGRPLSVDVAGGTIVNDHLTMIALAKAGAGLVYTADLVAAPEIESKRLRAVLSAYCISGPGLHLYFPMRSQQQPKLRAFIDFAKQVLRARAG